MRNRNRHFIV